MSFSTNFFIPQDDSLRPPHQGLPTMYDLPSEDPEEPGLPDEFHDLQPQLLSRTLQLAQYARGNYFTGTDLNVYYDVEHVLWHKRPDWFLVVDVPRVYRGERGEDLRLSYVVWQEGKSPDVVVEFLSPGTEKEDLGRFYDESWRISSEDEVETEPGESFSNKPPGKFEVYERRLKVPHYIVFSRYDQRLRYFKLENERYREQVLNSENPRIWLADLEIGLGIWTGTFDGLTRSWLRWCDRNGNWFFTDTEQERFAKEAAQRNAEQERLAREQAQIQLLETARNLLATGMTIDQVAQIMQLSEAQIEGLQSEAG